MADLDDRPGEASPTTKLYKFERYLTVTGMFRGSEKPGASSRDVRGPRAEVRVPFIRFSGKWLEAAGFDIDMRVRIRIMAGCSVLTTE